MPEIRFIRRIERLTSIEEIKKSLSNAKINISDCFIEQTVRQEELQGKFKFVRITLPSQTRADEFARALKACESIRWKLARTQPVQPMMTPSQENRESCGSGPSLDSTSTWGGRPVRGPNLGSIPKPPLISTVPTPSNFLGLPPCLPAFLTAMAPHLLPPLMPLPPPPLLIPPPPNACFPLPHSRVSLA